MIHEVLLALVGHPGDIIRREETGFYVTPGLPFLSAAEQATTPLPPLKKSPPPAALFGLASCAP